MIEKIKRNKILTITSIFVFIGILGIAYAVFTSNLNISGTGINRKSNFDIYFDNVSNFLTTGTASVTNSSPTVQSHTTVIEDYEATLATPGDSIYFTFDIVNDGDYDTTLTSLTIGPVKCSVNGNESDSSAQNVCSNIEYTMKYTSDNSNVSLNDTLASKETKEIKVTLKYKDFSDSSKLPTSNVTISNLGIDMVYTADSEAKTNSDGSTPKKVTAVSTLLAKSNDVNATYTYGSETSHQMYTFEHPKTEQTPALTDYRYIGSDPYNYVDFNGETWRIIGIFTVEDGSGNTSQRIKIIKDEKLSSNMAWDSNSVNEWPTASLNAYLNGDYYNGLSSTAKEMIEPAKTYLGGRRYDGTTHYGTAEDMYSWERGTDRYNASRSLNDTKNISLIYPSDYTYTYAKGIDNTCYSDGYNCDNGNPSLGWLYKSSHWWWTVSPVAGYSNFAFFVSSSGYVYGYDAHLTYGVRPVTYLISDISFEGNHTGSATDHYVLKK